jgi:hypothetical protein
VDINFPSHEESEDASVGAAVGSSKVAKDVGDAKVLGKHDQRVRSGKAAIDGHRRATWNIGSPNAC